MTNTKTQLNSVQEKLFAQIITKYPTKADALKELCTFLKVSKHNLYRKLKNKSSLKTMEFILLVRKYELSLDELMNNPNVPFAFHYQEATDPVSNTPSLNFPFKLLQQLLTAPNKTIYYLGAELPLFYFYNYPELIYFKESLWSRNNESLTTLDYAPIDFNVISNQDLQRYRKVWSLYAAIPSYEMWDNLGLKKILQEINYAYKVGIIFYDDFKLLTNKLLKLVDRLEKMLVLGTKQIHDRNNNLSVYFNPIISPTYFYIAQSDTINYVCGVYDPPNAVLTHNQGLITNAYNRFIYQREQCQLISGIGPIIRRQLLSSYRKDIQRLQNTIL